MQAVSPHCTKLHSPKDRPCTHPVHTHPVRTHPVHTHPAHTHPAQRMPCTHPMHTPHTHTHTSLHLSAPNARSTLLHRSVHKLRALEYSNTFSLPLCDVHLITCSLEHVLCLIPYLGGHQIFKCTCQAGCAWRRGWAAQVGVGGGSRGEHA